MLVYAYEYVIMQYNVMQIFSLLTFFFVLFIYIINIGRKIVCIIVKVIPHWFLKIEILIFFFFETKKQYCGKYKKN